MQGTIAGFYKQKGKNILPIVAFFNGDLKVVPEIKRDPKTRNMLILEERDGSKQPVVWVFKINALLDRKTNADHHLNFLINMLLDTIAKNKIGVYYRCAGNFKDPYIELITDSVKIDILDYIAQKNDTKKVQNEKSSVFGIPSIVKVKKQLNEVISMAATLIRIRDNIIIVQSKTKKVMVGWLLDDESLLDELKELEARRRIPMDILIGLALQDYIQVAIKPFSNEAPSMADILDENISEKIESLENDDHSEYFK